MLGRAAAVRKFVANSAVNQARLMAIERVSALERERRWALNTFPPARVQPLLLGCTTIVSVAASSRVHAPAATRRAFFRLGVAATPSGTLRKQSLDISHSTCAHCSTLVTLFDCTRVLHASASRSSRIAPDLHYNSRDDRRLRCTDRQSNLAYRHCSSAIRAASTPSYDLRVPAATAITTATATSLAYTVSLAAQHLTTTLRLHSALTQASFNCILHCHSDLCSLNTQRNYFSLIVLVQQSAPDLQNSFSLGLKRTLLTFTLHMLSSYR